MGRLGGFFGRLETKKVANMAATWLPKRDFLKDFARFWKQNGAKSAPRWHQKSMPTSKVVFLKKHSFPLGKPIILKVLEVEVGTKKGSLLSHVAKGLTRLEARRLARRIEEANGRARFFRTSGWL